MRVLLLGGTGFLGRKAERALRASRHEVVTVSRSPFAELRMDVEDDSLSHHLATAQYDAVVNLLGAGLSLGTADPAVMRRINSDLPPRLVAVLAELPAPPHLIHAASSTERLAHQTHDESEYSRSKHEGSVALRSAAENRGTPVTVLRIHNTYGPGQPVERFVAGITEELRSGRQVVLNYPDRVRDFVFVDDVAECIRHAVENPPPGLADAEAGTGTGLTLRESALTIARVLQRPASLITATEHPTRDANPVTVCPVEFGTYGLCTTEFTDGVTQTVGGL